MANLSFTVMPAGVAHLHDLLLCLAKFDENVSLEATPNHFCISSLNTSKTAHASFALEPASFFAKYHFSNAPGRNAGSGSDAGAWTCQLQNRALAAIFKKRNAEGRERDTALEHCEVKLDAQPDQTRCRIVIKMVCRHGVVKTYRLTYESTAALQANFDKKLSENVWTISSQTLHDVVEYFGPKTEQLDWFFENGKFTFTSYTEKVQNEILKQPMRTSVTLERKDFDDFNVQDGLHIGIIVRDFRAIIAHAESLRAAITARYSRSNRPMQITYEMDGVLACFTLMTRGNPSNIASDGTRSTPAADVSVRAISRTAEPTPAPSVPAKTQAMPPPNTRSFNPALTQSTLAKPSPRDSPPAPSASINPTSMFIPADDDQQWDEPDYADQPDFVTWDNASEFPSASNSTRRIRDSEPTSFRSFPDDSLEVQGIAPTQRLSQVKGLFD